MKSIGMEKIWYNDLSGMFTYQNYFIVLPTQTMTLHEKLNAIVRFFTYLGVLLALIKNDYKYIFLGVIAALVSVIINTYEDNNISIAEKFLEDKELAIVDNRVCSKSTVNNPFMNMSIADITLNPEHPAACRLDNPTIKKLIDTNFNARVFRDSGDIYGMQNSQRQFYTMPVTTLTNDQTGFGKWLYGSMETTPSCKEGNGTQCWRNIAELSVSGNTGNPSH